MIRYFARHPTAANLLMLGLLVLGLSAATSVRRETFPDFAPSEVEVRVVYPGATAEEVEEAICQRIEDALDGISHIEEIRSDAREGVGIVTVEMQEEGDLAKFLRDVEKEIDAIADFPTEAEDPVTTELGRTDLVLALLVSGPMAPPDLKAYCEELKGRMGEAGVPLVEILGFSDHQFRIELSSDALLRHGLSAAQVAEIVARQSVDLPAGAIEAREQEIVVRFVEQRRSPEELRDLVILAGRGGAEVRLGDLAEVRDVFDIDEDKVVMDGRRVAYLEVRKTKAQDTIRVADKVKDFIEREHERYPQMRLMVTQDMSLILVDRLQMLIKNGWQGLLLVFLTMWLFFGFKVSFWVAMGLPVSFVGAFFFVPQVGLTINMLTLVGLLLALGLMMDDAIVIAENIAVHRERGKSAIDATVDGTREVMNGVVSSFITTLCILGPLVGITGQIGRILRAMPMMLILVLGVSLIEAFLILPSHLGHAMHAIGGHASGWFRKRFDAFIQWVRESIVGRSVDLLLEWRYLFLGCVLLLLVLSISMLASGRLKVVGFPELEGDVVVARLMLPQGTPLKRTEEVVKQITDGLTRMNEKFKPRQPDQEDLVRNVYVQFNRNADAFESGPHVATVVVDLLSAETRTGRIDDYLQTWREEVGAVPDVISLTLGEPSVSVGGKPIEVRARGTDLGRLKSAARRARDWFAQFDGVMNLADDLRPGKPEVRMRLKEGAVGIGLDAATMAQQLRAAYQGMVADEVQVGREAYEIDVRLNRDDRGSLADLDYFHFTLPGGEQVPLKAAADLSWGRGWARIARFNGMRAVTLRGDVDPRRVNTNELIALFKKECLPGLGEEYPDLQIGVAGEIEENAKTQGSMGSAMLIGLIGVFILLSFQFRSYLEPLVVMLAIPMALIGVVWGHLLMGHPLSMPSVFGFIALAGIVVNDSILLVLFLKDRRQEGAEIFAAASQASRRRFRAITLTSTTTIAGLLPLLFERSLQAQILVPLVISTVFGLIASTVLVLLVIPCFYTVLGDWGLVSRMEVATGDEVSSE